MEPGSFDSNSLCREGSAISLERRKNKGGGGGRKKDKGNIFLSNNFKRLLDEAQGLHVPREACKGSKATGAPDSRASPVQPLSSPFLPPTI